MQYLQTIFNTYIYNLLVVNTAQLTILILFCFLMNFLFYSIFILTFFFLFLKKFLIGPFLM